MRRTNLKLAILSKFKTQRAFSKKNNICEKRVSGIVSGYYNPQPHEEKAIRRGLGMNDTNDNLFEMIK